MKRDESISFKWAWLLTFIFPPYFFTWYAYKTKHLGIFGIILSVALIGSMLFIGVIGLMIPIFYGVFGVIASSIVVYWVESWNIKQERKTE